LHPAFVKAGLLCICPALNLLASIHFAATALAKTFAIARGHPLGPIAAAPDSLKSWDKVV
jgi:hypothetical protein